jgi:hypothetical protein
MTLARGTNATLRFVLELCALAALGYWGFGTTDGALQWLLGLGAPVAFALAWGAFAAPKAPYRLQDPARLVFEAVVFALAAAALAQAGQPVLAGIFVVVVAFNIVLMFVLDQRGASGI